MAGSAPPALRHPAAGDPVSKRLEELWRKKAMEVEERRIRAKMEEARTPRRASDVGRKRGECQMPYYIPVHNILLNAYTYIR